MNPIFQTQRLTFTKATVKDINTIVDLENTPDTRDYIWQGTYENHLREINDDSTLLLIIRESSSDNLIGFCLCLLDKNSDVFKLKRIAIKIKGQGYGKETMKGIIHHCFNDLNMNRFWLEVYSFNKPGIALYESLNMHLDGELRQSYKHNKGYVDQRIYSILREEYLSQ